MYLHVAGLHFSTPNLSNARNCKQCFFEDLAVLVWQFVLLKYLHFHSAKKSCFGCSASNFFRFAIPLLVVVLSEKVEHCLEVKYVERLVIEGCLCLLRL